VDADEWLTCGEVRQLLAAVRETASQRKMRLFACACCRAIWHLLSDSRNRHAVETAEEFADGLCDEHQLAAANEASYGVYARTSAPGSGFADAAVGIARSSWEAAQGATCAAMAYTEPLDAYRSAIIAAEQSELAASRSALEDHPPGPIANYARRAAEAAARASQADLAREVFGNPFRRLAVSPAWLTSAVQRLAHGVYEERSFDCLPILADALEEAGCTEPEVLAHCRGPGPHVRGCWLVDLLLGKK
jgi:hypothetical protein